MADPLTILLVDDDAGKLASLESRLNSSNAPRFRTTAFSNPYEAFEWLERNQGGVEFAFIDHVFAAVLRPASKEDLPSLTSGIEFARHISKRWRDICIILYSNKPEITSDDEWRGLAAGAHRYVYVESGNDLATAATKELISEIRELRAIKKAMEDFQAGQQKSSVLQNAIRVGIDVIDRRFKTWFRNDHFTDIVGQVAHENCFCCAEYHGRAWPYCRGCLVVQALRMSRAEAEAASTKLMRTFYSPLCIKGRWVHKYLLVWAKPLFHEQEQAIAAVESVVDLTGSPTIEGMPLEQHLNILLQAVCELTAEWVMPQRLPVSVDGLWNEPDNRPGYRHARAYRIVPARHGYALDCVTSYPESGASPTGIPLLAIPRPRDTADPHAVALFGDDLRRSVDYRELSQSVDCNESPLAFALFGENKRLIGWCDVDLVATEGTMRLPDADDARHLQNHADEMARVLAIKLDRTTQFNVESSQIVETVQAKLALANTSEQALQIVLDGLVGYSGIEMGHIRLKEGDQLRLVASKGAYGAKAKRFISASDLRSLSARAAAGSFPIIINNCPDRRVTAWLETISAEAAPIALTLKSHAWYPLRSWMTSLGVLALHSTKEDVFSDRVVLVCSRLAELAAQVLNGMLTERKAEKRIEQSVWQEAAAAFAHQIGNTLPPADYRLDMLHRTSSLAEQKREDVEVAHMAVKRALQIASNFRKFSRRDRLEMSEITACALARSLEDYCRGMWKQARLEFITDLDENVRVRANLDSLKDAFATMVKDSVEFHPGRNPLIRVSIRVGKSDTTPVLQIIYEDNGPGVPGNIKDRIFEPFFSTRKGGAEHEGGTGVGLTDVLAIVVAHKGAIEEVGHPGDGLGGVLFRITIPLIDYERTYI